MKALTRFFSVAGLVGLVGCAGFIPQEGSSPEQVKAALTPAPDHGTVVVFIENGPSAVVLDENKRCLGFPSAGEWYVVSLPPGRHEIIAVNNQPAGKAIVVDVAGGRTYVLEGKAEPGNPNLLALTQVHRGSVEWGHLDFTLGRLSARRVVAEKCPEWIAKQYYDDQLDKLMALFRQNLAKAPPTLAPTDGVIYKGSFEASKE